MVNIEIPEHVRKARDCQSWFKYCKSECCTFIYLNVASDRQFVKGETYQFRLSLMTADLERYFTYRGFIVDNGLLIITLKDFVFDGKVLRINSRCMHLGSDGKCNIYTSPLRPKICELPNYAF